MLTEVESRSEAPALHVSPTQTSSAQRGSMTSAAALTIGDLADSGRCRSSSTDHMNDGRQTYQLWITVCEPLQIEVGRLGRYRFPPGWYVYSGSARRNLSARLARHLTATKRMRWHIDYLLAAPSVLVRHIRTFDAAECDVNRETPGVILVRRFGASDCRAGCGSHLKFLRDCELHAVSEVAARHAG